MNTSSGQYCIVNAVSSDEMHSDGNATTDHSYELPGVPSVQSFTEVGAAIHGTYWHDMFGTQESQCCVSLTIGDGA